MRLCFALRTLVEVLSYEGNLDPTWKFERHTAGDMTDGSWNDGKEGYKKDAGF